MLQSLARPGELYTRTEKNWVTFVLMTYLS